MKNFCLHMRKMALPVVAIWLASVMVHSCEDIPHSPIPEGIRSEEKPDKEPKKEEKPILNPWRDLPYKLNVVYFVPTGVDTLPQYRERISGVLLHMQKFYAEGLKEAGYADRSFGLSLLSDSLVRITTLRSEMTKQEAVKGYQRAIKEVNAYFDGHPEERTSDHTLIIMPSFREDPKNPGGPPFFGVGRNCFALDYLGMAADSLGLKGREGNLATQWIGGMAHELGHGLNAPHNKQHRTEECSRGTALMGTGNYTYGKKPTYLTPASAALFTSGQAFATKTRNDWYRNVGHSLIKIKGEYREGKIIISGKYFSSLPVHAVIVYHDREPYQSGNDYDALAWPTRPAADNTFRVECPLEDFYDRSGKYELRVDFYHENGTKKNHKFHYAFDDALHIPRIESINSKDVMDRDGWRVVETDSHNPGNEGKNLLDGDPGSIWQTKWKGVPDPLPHHFVVDMGSAKKIAGFGFANRGDLNGAMKDIEIFKSNDRQNWTSVGKFQLEPETAWQYTDLSEPQTMRYVKVVAISTNKGSKHTHLGEFVAY